MNLISLDELKKWLKIEHSYDDTFFNLAITLFSEYIEIATGRSFIQKSPLEYHDGGDDTFVLKVPPISSIVAVTDTDPTPDLVLPAADYDFYPDSGVLYIKTGIFAKGKRRWLIDYVGGFSTVPNPIKIVCMSLIAKARDLPDLQADREQLAEWVKSRGHDSEVEEIIHRYKAVYV